MLDMLIMIKNLKKYVFQFYDIVSFLKFINGLPCLYW